MAEMATTRGRRCGAPAPTNQLEGVVAAVEFDWRGGGFASAAELDEWLEFLAWEPKRDPCRFVWTFDRGWVDASPERSAGDVSLDAIRGAMRSELAAALASLPLPVPVPDRASNAFDADAACDEVLASLGYRLEG